LPFESVGRPFESGRAYHKNKKVGAVQQPSAFFIKTLASVHP
jgi:hypothetical protein